MLVALEGIAGAGKTTLLKELSSCLKKVHFVDEFCDDYINGYIDYLIKRDPYLRLPSPSETPLSQAIILMGGLIYKYETKIKPYLRGRNIVIVDRYKDSIYAYQLETAYMQGIRDRGSTYQWLKDCLSILPDADLTLYLSADDKCLQDRLARRGGLSDELSSKFRNAVHKNYTTLMAAKKNGVISIDSENSSLEESVRYIISALNNLRDKKATLNANIGLTNQL